MNKTMSLNKSMNQASDKKKLVWQCRRGMLELDVILIPFLEEHFETLEQNEQHLFSQLLTADDPDLYTWLMGYGKSDNEQFNLMIQIIRHKMGISS